VWGLLEALKRTSLLVRMGQVQLPEMRRQVAVVLYVVAMAAIIVGVDFVFFRNRFWERLTVNVGIVLVFAAFYLRFLRRQ
jgi:cytochrome c oxidase subunit IV